MIGSIILIVIVAGAIGYLVFGVQKNKKANAVVESIESKVEELQPKLEVAVDAKVKELKPKAAKPKATQAAKSKVTVTKQKTK